MEDQKKEIILTVVEEGHRLDKWLSEQLEGFSRSHIQKLIDSGSITVNGHPVRSSLKTEKNMCICITIPEAEKLDALPQDIPIKILYEDDSLLVIDKPKGMVVHPAAGNWEGTLVNALLFHRGDSLSDINGVIRPGIVHRIDKETSGLLVVAKNNQAHLALSEDLKEHRIIRIYEAIVEGRLKADGTIKTQIGRHPKDRKKMAVLERLGRIAITHYKVLETYSQNTLVECKLETGRTHQIRVHMAYLGHPIVGDTLYGRENKRLNISGQALHARELFFTHPITKEEMHFVSPLPEYFDETIRKLRHIDCL